MKRWIVLCAWATTQLALLLALPQMRAYAADITALGDAVAADRLELSKLAAAMSDEVAENAGYKRDYDVYDGQMKSRLNPLIDAYNAKLATHNDYAAKVNAQVGRHNAGCRGTVPAPAYAQCKSEEPPLQKMIDDVNARKTALDAEKADLARQQDQFKTAMDGLAAKMSANRAAWEQNKARREDLSAKIAVAAASLADQCKDTPLDQRNALQYLKYCAAPDTIDRVLKSLDEVAPPQGTPARSN